MPRRAFTLLELIVVILIVGIVAALLLPSLIGAGTRAREQLTLTRIRDLETALAAFKARFGVYPPSRIVLMENPALYDDSNELHHRSTRWLRRIWPQLRFDVAWDLDGDAGATTRTFTLDGFKCLLFFLCGMPEVGASGQALPGIGFSKDPENPFSRAAGTRDGPFYTGLRTSDLRDGSDDDGNAATRVLFREIADPLGTDRSLAYFSAYGGAGYRPDDCTLAAEGTQVFRINGAETGAVAGPNPYTQGEACPGGPGSGGASAVFWKADSFQIISAGADGLFGAGGNFTPGANVLSTLDGATRDNLTNLFQGRLSEARE